MAKARMTLQGEDSMGKIRFNTSASLKIEFATIPSLLFVFCLAASLAASAQTYATLATFSGESGGHEGGPLIEGRDGNFYGIRPGNGTPSANCTGELGCGIVFRVTPAGQLTKLYNFCAQNNCTDGFLPEGSLLIGANGDFYGVTSAGGTNCAPGEGCGTVFEITAAGKLTTIYSFCSLTNCTDGNAPQTGLTLGADGNFYGTTKFGGANCTFYGGCGTIYKITPAGKLTTLYNFCSAAKCADGRDPNVLVLGGDGNFYGTTGYGSACTTLDCGTVFKMTPAGELTTLHTFCSQANCADGKNPLAGMVQATNGNLYGTTADGGANCAYFGGCGTVFQITTAGELSTLYNFCSKLNIDNGHCTDGLYPFGALIQASDGNFYSTTSGGGPNNGHGTVFELTSAGELTTLYSFCSEPNCKDGSSPQTGLLQGSNGIFYGTTRLGGSGADGGDSGVVYSLATGLGPAIK
jgi:uncharacterized repeat protein (TIGR03803 family)